MDEPSGRSTSGRSTYGRLLPTGRKNAAHIAEDYDIFDFELTTDDMKRIRSAT